MRINLGGEGEIPDMLNQQGRWVLRRSWRSCRRSKTLKQRAEDGHDFLLCDNTHLSLPDGCCDVVYTKDLPGCDKITYLEPTVQTTEVLRILKSGGRWIENDEVRYVKP